MLVSLKANNFMIYDSEIEFSMQANLHHKHFKNNYSNHGELNVLKTAIIIGPNNSGKTNYVRVVSAIKPAKKSQEEFFWQVFLFCV